MPRFRLAADVARKRKEPSLQKAISYKYTYRTKFVALSLVIVATAR
jgi:hypothetical protein